MHESIEDMIDAHVFGHMVIREGEKRRAAIAVLLNLEDGSGQEETLIYPEFCQTELLRYLLALGAHAKRECIEILLTTVPGELNVFANVNLKRSCQCQE